MPLFRLLPSPVLLLFLLPSAFSQDIPFVEQFALADDRAKALEQLVPGTEDYYFFHCLHYQNTGDADAYKDTLDKWIRRHRGHVPAKARELMNRQALLDYDADPKKTFDYVRDQLKLKFEHKRASEVRTSTHPAAFDNAKIARDTLLARALAEKRHLNRLEDHALELVADADLSPDQRRNLLSRLKRPDFPRIVDHIVADLKHKGSRGFGHHGIHKTLLLAQLDALLEREPKLRNHNTFVQTYLARLRPGVETDLDNEPAARQAYYDRLWAYVSTLDPAHNSLKACVLHNRLLHDQSQGIHDRERFLTYLQLPRNIHYIHPELRKKANRSEYLAQPNKSFGLIALPPIRNEEPIVRDYLLHFLTAADNYDDYRTLIEEPYLKRIFATAKILNGIGDPESWASHLSPSEYKALKERVDIDFAPTNASTYAPDDPVSLTVHVKNVPSLIVKVFEINTVNYYHDTGKPLNLALNLDGLVASHETRQTYEDPAERRIARTFDLPQLKGRGVWVVELIGNGKSSRALIQKGQLRLHQEITAAGHSFQALDAPKASIWLGGREFSPGDDGRIHIPFSTQPKTDTLIVRDGNFASLVRFKHLAETYQLHAGIYVDRESLLRRNKATLVVRPVLTVNGRPASLELLQDVRLNIRSTDFDGVSSEKDLADFALFEDRESTYEFLVPEKLASLDISLHARVENITRSQKQDLAASASFSLNAIDQSQHTHDYHLSRTADGYFLELRGKNGEPRADLPLHLELKHRDFKDSIKADLRSNERGRTALGNLADIAWLRVRGQGIDHRWNPRDDAWIRTAELHAAPGGTLELPIVIANAVLSDFSLLDHARDHRDSLKIENGFLLIDDLPVGDYSLHIKPLRHTVTVRIANSARRALETPRLKPANLISTEVGDESVELQLANANDFTRVHVIASRFMPSHDAFTLGQTHQPRLGVETWQPIKSLFVSGRDIGDEYRYILDRQVAKKFPGNSLERPGLLLNPWDTRDTAAKEEQLAAGGKYQDAAMDMNAMAATDAMLGRRAGGGAGGTAAGFPSLDFLANPAVTLYNLRPDENGKISIPRADLQGKPHLRILVTDPETSLLKTVLLPDSPTPTRDLRLRLPFKPEVAYAEQKLISIAAPGKDFQVADLSTSSLETYDSLAKVYRLFSTLNEDSTFGEFRFVLDWHKYDADKKGEQYSKYASHELNLFLYHKDRDFFNAVIQPYLANKKDKTFVDEWLLGDDLARYLEPWRFQRLNIVERALLARRIGAQRGPIGRHVKELADLLPPDPQGFDHRFDTAVKTSALEETAMDNMMVEATTHTITATGGIAFGGDFGGAAAALDSEDDAFGDFEMAEAKQSIGRRMAKEKVATIQSAKESDKSLYFRSQAKGRKLNRAWFKKLDATKEWAENNYYRRPIAEQVASLITVSDFWADYAAHADGPFLSQHLAEATRSFPEMMLALAVLDLPFVPGEHKETLDDIAYTFQPASPAIIFHKEIRQAERASVAPILVAQRFFRADDAYRMENGERIEKVVTEEFLPHVVYGARVVLTNPTASRQKLRALLQIPAGAIPVQRGFFTKGQYVQLEPYHTQSIEYFFYFPATGEYPHYPVHVAHNEQVVAVAQAFQFKVVERLTQEDRTSWPWISQKGSLEDVLDFLRANNVQEHALQQVAWRMKEKPAFDAITSLLASRHAYDQTLWSYGVFHRDPAIARDFLRHSPFADRVGLWLKSPLLDIDPVERHRYQHLEYAPLVNARAHQVSARRKILNTRLLGQYTQAMTRLAYQPEIAPADRLAITYYLALQDRIEEALANFASLDRETLSEKLQYDYLAAYLALFREDLDTARTLAANYANHPVDRWRNRFANLANQLADEVEAIDDENREQTQAVLAATAPALELRVESREIQLEHANLETATLNFYPMDIELLFSRNPFIQQQSAAFSYIRPVMTREVALTGNTTSIALPAEFANANVMVECVAAGIRKSQAYFANRLSLRLIENYGQLQVTDAATAKPLSKVYVKVYARGSNGVKFFKDGYTDFRGRFDYVSLNTNELDGADRLALLVMDEKHGTLVREAAPPKR